MSDDLVVEKVTKSAQAGKFLKLMTGDITGYTGASEADIALASILCFWTQDAEQIERIMRRSTLVRGKWDTGRPGGTYISTTIEKALDSRTEVYTGAPILELGLVPLNTIDMRPVPWLWPGYLPQGATSLFVGDPGNGKTLSGLDLLARVTVGAVWPDGTPNAPIAGAPRPVHVRGRVDGGRQPDVADHVLTAGESPHGAEHQHGREGGQGTDAGMRHRISSPRGSRLH